MCEDTVFLTDLADSQNERDLRTISPNVPARSTVKCSSPKGANVEIEAIAVAG